MKIYKLRFKYNGEVINKFTCDSYEKAILFFSLVKKLKKEDLLSIFSVTI